MSSCGHHATALLTEYGDLFVWGTGVPGVLGLGDRINQMTPQRLGGDKVFGDRLVQVSMQKNHCCAVTEKGSVFTWGDGAAGRLGHGDQESKLKPKQIPKETFAGAPVLMVTGGERHSVALTVDGRLWIWGWRCSGRLGLGYLDGPEDENRYVPTPLPMANFPSNVVMIAAGEAHTLALTHMGDVFTWGSGAGWRLGFDDNADRHVPVLLQERSNFESRVLSISAGSHHNMAVTTEGKLWAWGDSEFGQVGLGERRRCKPTPLNPNTKTKMNLRWLAARAFGRKGKSKPFDGARVVMAACGYFHTLALTDTGSVWAWGRNCDGALGVHDDLHRMYPVQIRPEAFGNDKIVLVMGGLWHSTAVTEHGIVYSWGKAHFQYVPGMETQDEDYEAMAVEYSVPVESLKKLMWCVQKCKANKVFEPKLLAPTWLRGARVASCRMLPPLNALAFAMVTHPRLGARSIFHRLVEDLVKRILEGGRLWPHESACEGFRRMLGSAWVWG